MCSSRSTTARGRFSFSSLSVGGTGEAGGGASARSAAGCPVVAGFASGRVGAEGPGREEGAVEDPTDRPAGPLASPGELVLDGEGEDPGEGDGSGPLAGDAGVAAGGSLCEAVGVTATLARGDPGSAEAACAASRRDGGRLEVWTRTLNRVRSGSSSRMTPTTMVVCAGMRSSRSIRSVRERIGRPSRPTMRSPGRSPARSAGESGRTSSSRAPRGAPGRRRRPGRARRPAAPGRRYRPSPRVRART